MTGRKYFGKVSGKLRRKIQKKEKMNNTTFTVYWLETNKEGKKTAYFEQSPHMRASMKLVEALRNHPSASAITFCSENPDQVGKMGVDAVVGGVLPDGQEYVYKTGRGNP